MQENEFLDKLSTSTILFYSYCQSDLPIPMSPYSEEFVRRSGHRFNIIVKTLSTSEDEAIPMETLHQKLVQRGYREGIDQLAVDVGALVKRGEVSFSLMSGSAVYWATAKGLFEVRKRAALIRLHNLEISEEDLAELERLARKGKPRLE